MSIIVTDTGFGSDTHPIQFHGIADIPANDCTGCNVDLPPNADPYDLQARLSCFDVIRVDFPSFADGRGLTIARRLRLMGYTGRLRARGHVLADQYAMMRRSGFDEVEISADLAARQPEDQWRARANWTAHDYQTRMRG